MRKISRIIQGIIIFIIHCFYLHSQIWIADFSGNKELNTSNGWFFVKDFNLNNNSLNLDAPENTYGNTIIIKKIVNMPSDSIRWQGTISLDKYPTSKNNAYILLAMINNIDNPIREYICIKLTDNIEFGILKHSWIDGNGIRKDIHNFNYKRIQGIKSYPYSSELIDDKLSFNISYNSINGWSMVFSTDQNANKKILFSIDINKKIPPLSNIIYCGFAVTYTKKNNKMFHCYNFSIKSIKNEEDNISENEDPENNKIPIGKPKDPDFTNEKHIIINEIMANPETGAPEFIELYNPTNEKIYLRNYYLVYKSGSKIKLSSLKDIESISSKEYLLLSKQSSDIPNYYSGVTSNICKKIEDMPILSNTRFEIGLGYGNMEETFDEVLYDINNFPKGYKTKKGYSLQRVNEDSDSKTEEWIISTNPQFRSTPGRANYNRLNILQSKLDSINYDISSNSIYEAYQLMKTSKRVDLEITINSIDGYLINKYTGDKAESFLTNIVESPHKLYLDIINKRQIILLSILFRNSRLGTKLYTYKFIIIGL